MLTEKQLNDVCLLDQGADECRYLDSDDNGCFVCRKKSLERGPIDQEVTEYFDECKKDSKDPYQADHPLGDNCQGFLPLKDLPQGYDI